MQILTQWRTGNSHGLCISPFGESCSVTMWLHWVVPQGFHFALITLTVDRGRSRRKKFYTQTFWHPITFPFVRKSLKGGSRLLHSIFRVSMLCLSVPCSLCSPVSRTYGWDCRWTVGTFFVSCFALHTIIHPPHIVKSAGISHYRPLPYGVCLTGRVKSIWHWYICAYFKLLQ